MGRRSRKRSADPGAVPPDAPVERPGSRAHAAPPRAPDRRARATEAPKAPWSPFPLSELAILLSLIMLVGGLFTEGARREWLLGGGLLLITLSAGELAVREHFAGFRSHSGLLAGIGAILGVIPLFFLTSFGQEVLLAIATVVFLLLFWRLRDAFARRSGGLSWRA